MKPTRIAALLLGCLLAAAGFGLVIGAGALGWGLAFERDDDGFFRTSTERYESPSFAITSEEVDLGTGDADDWWADRDLATVRLRVDSASGEEVFVGIGAERDVERYLAGVPHQELSDVRFGPFEAEYRNENAAGDAVPGRPAAAGFWVASATGPGAQTLTWDVEPGRWAVVLMNADGSPGVGVDLQAGLRFDWLVPVTIAIAVAGGLLLALGAGLILAGAVGGGAAAVSGGAPMVPAGAYPLRFEGRLDPGLSRWQWLVKWFLAIPHFVALAFLWVAFSVLTLVAFFAILFTGRYPKALFDFNVGVLRWSWRVGFYATSQLGTDRYPPFSLADDPSYPARLDVAYPERLSRGLVLVKWWLLALPHLLLVGLFTASWGWVRDDGWRFGANGGLLQLLTLVAGVALLVTGRYPQGLYDLLMGLNRWIYRVTVYVALMTDRYPPFRLDQGPSDPPVPAPLPPSGPAGAGAIEPEGAGAPERDRELVSN
jgi:hypothetical protein